MKLIYTHKKPEFHILVDEDQWIFSTGSNFNKKTSRTSYKRPRYFQNISGLLDDLAEWWVCRTASESATLRGIQDTVLEVYKELDKLSSMLDINKVRHNDN